MHSNMLFINTERRKNHTSPSVDGSTPEYCESQTTSVIFCRGPRGISGNDSAQS